MSAATRRARSSRPSGPVRVERWLRAHPAAPASATADAGDLDDPVDEDAGSDDDLRVDAARLHDLG